MCSCAALGLGWLLAVLGHLLARKRVLTARQRLREVLGDEVSIKEIKRIAWLSLRNTVFSGVEMMRLPKMSAAQLSEVYTIEGIKRFQEKQVEEGGAILGIPHMGNWEMAGLSARAVGIPIFFITGSQKNRLVDAWMNRIRGITGIETIPRDSSVLKRVIRNLRSGKVLAIMPDLRAKTPGIDVNFFGGTANFTAGTGMFARQAGVAIYPVIVRRIGWAKHVGRIYDPIYPDKNLEKKADWTRMTQIAADIYDAAVREHPEQYFWYNKRWVLDPLKN